MASELVRTLDASSLTVEALSQEKLMFVDFWAPWCGPCRMVAPFIDQLADEFKGQVSVGKLNVDDFGETAASFGVASIPTMLLIQNGQEIERIVGARSYTQLADLIRKHL